MVLRQGGEPERELGQVHRQRVLVHAVEAALGHHAAGVEYLVLVGGMARHAVVGVPGPHQQLGQEAANLDEERPGAHGRVAISARGSARGGARAEATRRLERRRDDGLGEGARRVVRARPPALGARLEHDGPGRHDPRGVAAKLTLRLQGRDGVLGRSRLLHAAAAWPVTAWRASPWAA